MIKIHQLTVAYQDKVVLEDLDLEIPHGSLMAIVGPNGAGKSTFIKALLGIIKPKKGTIQFEGIQKKDIAYVPQQNHVQWNFPITVFDVVLMGQYVHLGKFKFYRKHHRQAAQQAIKAMNIEDIQHRHIQQLSGGQKQRVFLARALCQDAKMIILDEPLAGIDAKSEKEIIHHLKQLHRMGKTIICVHHDLKTLKEYFDSVIFLNKKIFSIGKTQDVVNEETIQKTYGEVSL